MLLRRSTTELLRFRSAITAFFEAPLLGTLSPLNHSISTTANNLQNPSKSLKTTQQPNAILQRLSTAESPNDVLHLVATDLASLDGTCTATAIHRIGQLCCTNADTKRQITETKEFQALLATLHSKSHRRYSAADIARILWSLASLNYVPGRETNIMASLCMKMPTILQYSKSVSPQTIATIFNSLSALNYRPSPYLQEVLEDVIMERLDNFKAGDISTTLVGIARFNLKESPLIQHVCTRAFALLDTCTPQDISTIVWSLSKLQLGKDKRREKAVVVELVTAAVGPALQQLQSFSKEQLVQTLSAYGRLRIDPGTVFIESLATELTNKIEQMTPNELSSIAQAMQLLQHWHVPLFQAISKSCLSSTIKDALQPYHYANILLSYAYMRYTPDERLIDALVTKGLGDGGDEQGSSFSSSCRSSLLTEENGWTPWTIAQIAWSLVVMAEEESVKPYIGRFMKPLAKSFILQASHPRQRMALTDETLTKAFWACTVADITSPVVWDAFASLINQYSGHKRNLYKADLIRVYQAWLLQTSRHPNDHWPLHPELLDRAKNLWTQGEEAFSTSNNPKYSHSSISRLQREVYTTLQSMGYNAQLEKKTNDGLFSVDIAVVSADDVQIAVEVDGPRHFVRDSIPPRFNARTRIRNELLEARGWRVVSVGYHRWDACGTEEERARLLRELLSDS